MDDTLKDSAERAKVMRLVSYLTRLASLRTKLIRDVNDYQNQNVLWMSDVPHERDCFTQTCGREEEHEPDEWLEVQNRREPALPADLAQCKDWVNPPSLHNKNDLPELFPEITRQIQNPDWREGSDQTDSVSKGSNQSDGSGGGIMDKGLLRPDPEGAWIWRVSG
ncbi:MAG: hypothetical protein PHC35_10235 [Deltaproteobacteria bacterium]|nr:hypothetical protein [Deltaproteobacteria bacterium]